MVLSSFSPKLSRGGTTIRHERVAEMEPSYDADVCASWQKKYCSPAANSLKSLNERAPGKNKSKFSRVCPRHRLVRELRLRLRLRQCHKEGILTVKKNMAQYACGMNFLCRTT